MNSQERRRCRRAPLQEEWRRKQRLEKVKVIAEMINRRRATEKVVEVSTSKNLAPEKVVDLPTSKNLATEKVVKVTMNDVPIEAQDDFVLDLEEIDDERNIFIREEEGNIEKEKEKK